MDLWLRGALAAAARSLGETAPQREALTAARAQLADADAPDVELAATRRRVAAAGDEEERLRERVATLRGRLHALDDAGVEAERAATAEELSTATRALTDAETERIAAEQRLATMTREARGVRDRRERRLELQDRVANLERRARAHLAGAVYERFRAAVSALPGEGEAGAEPGDYEGDPTTAALAAVRVADVAAPVVVATDRLGDAAAAATRLDAPVVRP
jgi:chromosome segregation ATPase